jgi:hypothetical protein
MKLLYTTRGPPRARGQQPVGAVLIPELRAHGVEATIRQFTRTKRFNTLPRQGAAGGEFGKSLDSTNSLAAPGVLRKNQEDDCR